MNVSTVMEDLGRLLVEMMQSLKVPEGAKHIHKPEDGETGIFTGGSVLNWAVHLFTLSYYPVYVPQVRIGVVESEGTMVVHCWTAKDISITQLRKELEKVFRDYDPPVMILVQNYTWFEERDRERSSEVCRRILLTNQGTFG